MKRSVFYIACTEMLTRYRRSADCFNPLNAELNPICHLLALLGAHPILHVSRIRVKDPVRTPL
jgi:hypothetical protein